MTRRVILELDLNENDFDALTQLIADRQGVAQYISPSDPRVRSRVVDLLVQIGAAVERIPMTDGQ
ncbi:hypothetical protein [Pseudomonas sp. EA_65y_Pfl2_P74]|uniref:hypothetical protein n=1 Tax=Pseudomonas sp. EA_65y_Pfl2_P74 TaxID=3088694 RepID=UPI0030DCF329